MDLYAGRAEDGTTGILDFRALRSESLWRVRFQEAESLRNGTDAPERYG